ncbi:hypothetical protein J4220_00665, partial [Candidatus Micrarchaeota archaeon]|nr:hypothetical protein [Candidatus Micrarchaeota archaeon]
AIRALSFAGYLNAMLLASILFAVLSVLVFYKILKEFKYTDQPFYIAALFAFIPPRWLIYHSVGAAESMFVFLTLLSFYFYKKDQHAFAAVSGTLAAVTKILGVLLFPFFIAMLFLGRKKADWRSYCMYALIPLALIAHFLFFQSAFGDFWIYLKVNAGGVSATPFSTIASSAALSPAPEFYVGIYAITALGISRAFKKDKALALFALLFFIPALFINLRDVSRYLIPAMPFALLIGFEDILKSKEFKRILPLVIVLVYLYAWTFTAADLDHLMPGEYWTKAMAFFGR